MISKSVSIEFLQNQPSFKELIEETLDDRLIYKEGLEVLSQSHLIILYKGDQAVGFYSLDDLGDCVEAHAYIFKSYRKYSLEALRFIIASQSKDIKTSVYGTHLHVLKFLTKVGFTITDILDNALVKNGTTHNVIELIYIKEKPNG
ncbi:MAG: hypothetical protein ACRC6V_00190 [Bacteroidales bacterium]